VRILLGLPQSVGKRIQKRSAVFVLLFFPLVLTFHLHVSPDPQASRKTLVALADALIGVFAATVALLIVPLKTRSKSQ
jgi:hypothetical protein